MENFDYNYIANLIQDMMCEGMSMDEIQNILAEYYGVEVKVTKAQPVYCEQITEEFHTNCIGSFEMNVN